MKKLPPLLPLFNSGELPDLSSQSTPIFTDLPPPSDEVPAILWVLENSTDPRVVETAADLALNSQWPVGRDFRNSLKRLADVFNGCFDGNHIRDGMEDRATSCIRGFGVLQMINNGQFNDGFLEPSLWSSVRNEELAITTIFFQLYKGAYNFPDECVIGQWTLRFLSAGKMYEDDLEWLLQNFEPDEASLRSLSVLADFLFCINSFFAIPNVHDLSLMDKR
ncbi:hypothetical protein C8R44DRAFT_865634 [Mycena epipterygia]|nr:hypothetical protein C8R44DRAFT_865634 [Mycena epipterygia]